MSGIFFTNVPAPPGIGGAYPGYEFWPDGDGLATVRIINSAATPYWIDVKGSTDLSDGKWHVVAATYDGSGVAAGVLIALGPRARLPVAAGAMVATIVANLMGDRTLLSSVVFALCNAGEALLAAWLIERFFGSGFNLGKLSHVLGMLVCAIVATAVSGLGGTAGFLYFHSSNAQFLTIWQHWFASDALGIITVAPLIIQIASAARKPPLRRGIMEGAAALVALVILNGFVIFLPQGFWGTIVPVALLFPVLLWLAARCHPVFAATAAFISALTIVLSTTFGIGFFGDASFPISERILGAQASILAVSFCVFVLVALFAERRLHETALVASGTRLQEAVTELRLLYENAPIGLAFLTPDCRYRQINRRLTEICGLSIADHIGKSVRNTVPQVADQVELLESRYTVIQIDFFNDLAVLDAQHRRARDVRFPSGCSGSGAARWSG